MRKLLFPSMMLWWLIMMLLSEAFPRFFVPGINWLFFFAAIACAILSWVGFVWGGK